MEPLIWTSLGNLPIASLEYRCGWDETPAAVTFWEEHWLADECVKRAAHVLSRVGVTGDAVANPL